MRAAESVLRVRSVLQIPSSFKEHEIKTEIYPQYTYMTSQLQYSQCITERTLNIEILNINYRKLSIIYKI